MDQGARALLNTIAKAHLPSYADGLVPDQLSQDFRDGEHHSLVNMQNWILEKGPQVTVHEIITYIQMEFHKKTPAFPASLDAPVTTVISPSPNVIIPEAYLPDSDIDLQFGTFPGRIKISAEASSSATPIFAWDQITDAQHLMSQSEAMEEQPYTFNPSKKRREE